MQKKIKVVWLCHVVNDQIKSKLNYGYPWPERLINRILGRKTSVTVDDYARWNTNAINEMRNNSSIELHVVSQFPYLLSEQQTYVEDGITFHFFRADDFTFSNRLRYIRNATYRPTYEGNTRLIQKTISRINPDIIHVMGAENPNYGKAVLTMETSAPIIVQLQTLMNMPNFKAGYKISDEEYNERASLERMIIQRADYVGTAAQLYVDYLKSQPEFQNKKFLNTTLALTEPVQRVDYPKEYDVVYFAAEINKAADVAIEAFGKIQEKIPNVSMVVIGGYGEEFIKQLDDYILSHNIKNINFTGRLQKYEDVIATVRTAKIALLPLKVDLISGTIRECMANGIPVVTTITPSTPKLNRSRESVLLNNSGDTEGLSENVIKLLTDSDFYNTIRQNAFDTADERGSNKMVVENWLKAYNSCLNDV